MLLSGYTKRISRPECNPSSEAVYCVARLNEDVSEVLPFLNAVEHGVEYFRDPPEVIFRLGDRIVKVGAREIAINRLADEAEADRILAWWKNKINEVWEQRKSIVPSYEGKVKPGMIEVLRLLPKTNCKKCGRPTCMVFASQVVEGKCSTEQCPGLSAENSRKLAAYLSGFTLD